MSAANHQSQGQNDGTSKNMNSIALSLHSLSFVKATEMAAIAASAWRGKGDEMSADQAAAEALGAGLNAIPLNAEIALGEGTHSESDMFGVGQTFGAADGEKVDIAVDPLEGTTLCAKGKNDALVVLAASSPGGLMRVPAVYMHKLVIAAGYPSNTVDLSMTPAENVQSLAKAKGVPVSEVTACVLDRPRHATMIADLREIGCAVRLLGDGDIAGAIHAANPEDSRIDIYLGSGGAPEGVLAAAAIRCLGGFMQTQFLDNRPDIAGKLNAFDIKDHKKIYAAEDLAAGDVLFAATGVTSGSLVEGVTTTSAAHATSTILMETWSGTVRRIASRHTRKA